MSTNTESTPKFDFYLLPDAILERMKNGEEMPSEELSQYLISQADLEVQLGHGDCHIEGHSTITCTCSKPGQPPYTRTGNCDIYYRMEGGVTKYCYTRSQSCYYVCS